MPTTLTCTAPETTEDSVVASCEEAEEEEKSQAAVLLVVSPKHEPPAPWSLPIPTKREQQQQQQQHTTAISFIDIMNDQHTARTAGRAAFRGEINSSTMALADIQAEQERLFASLSQQSTPQQQHQLPHPPNVGEDEDEDENDEEERILLEMVMKQSLEESKNTSLVNNNHHSDNNTGNLTPSPLPAVAAAASSSASSSSPPLDNRDDNVPKEASAIERFTTNTTNGDNNSNDCCTSSTMMTTEQEMIEAAIREADANERLEAESEAESIQLALQLQQEELTMARQQHREQQQQQQHRTRTATEQRVRLMTRSEFEAEHMVAENLVDNDHYYDNDSTMYRHHNHNEGFRMNASSSVVSATATTDPSMVSSSSFSQQQASLGGWYRRDRNTIIGPDNEVRTKHDTDVQGQTNATYLDLDIIDDDTGRRAHLGNTAFNAFRKTVAGSYHSKGGQRGTTKGVATFGVGRADSDKTKGGALDQHTRLHISRAINTGLIERCNGVVKQGKEAAVYHADGGSGTSTSNSNSNSNSNAGFDVAVKVFKRIKEFRGRGEYVDGDPRYANRGKFRSLTDRQQLDVWTEKEYRNLARAYKSKVPVPNPIQYKENVLFMRFLGEEGWPAPQLREIKLRQSSSKWSLLYDQVMDSIQKLFQAARLVHGDLSEYNILVAPKSQVDHYYHNSRHDHDNNDDNNQLLGVTVEKQDEIIDDVNKKYNNSNKTNDTGDLQIVLIDFGQSVEVRHPKAEEFLKRDLKRVYEFFVKQGLKKPIMNVDESFDFVVGDKHTFMNIENMNMPGNSFDDYGVSRDDE